MNTHPYSPPGRVVLPSYHVHAPARKVPDGSEWDQAPGWCFRLTHLTKTICGLTDIEFHIDVKVSGSAAFLVDNWWLSGEHSEQEESVE